MPSESADANSARANAATQQGPAETSPLAVQPTPLAGIRVGPFEIKGFLGRGGFGEVFLAEQAQPVHRLAAVKMLAPGRTGGQFREHFDAERRVLAQIDHPNVARMLDAGTTPDGRDWVALEYVPGQPIDLYCDQNQLTVEQRIGLLIQVARAVDFAHQKGVVHRDLKPTNILVSVDGGRAVAKIIDFGIARVLGVQPPGAEPGAALGSPGFMAPEQAVSAGADADARADVYALGSILHLLCTGRVPARHAAPFMSQCVQRMPAEEAAAAAAARRTSVRGLAHELREDLDWIAGKCLDHDRMRRYADAGDLGEDLRRWQRKRPVEAAPRTLWYRGRKFVQRNRAAVVATTILGAACAVMLTASVLGWKQAIEQRDAASAAEDRAADQAIEARAAAAFISGVLGAASLNRAPEGAALTVVDWLGLVASAADVELKDRPAIDAAVRLALGRTYTSLGLLDQAEAQLVRAAALANAVYSTKSDALAECLEAIAEVGLAREQIMPARARADEARRILDSLPGNNNHQLARNSMLQAQISFHEGKPQASLDELKRAAAELGAASSPDRAMLSSIQWYRALDDLDLGDYAAALAAIEDNLAYNAKNLPSDHWWIAESQSVQAAALAGLGKVAEAQQLLEQAMPRLQASLRQSSAPMRMVNARAAFVAQCAGDTALAQKYRALASTTPSAPGSTAALPLGTPGMHTPASTRR